MKAYYVTVVRGKRVGWLAGPFASLEGAEGRVSIARRIASDLDPWTDFDAFGVTALERDCEWGVLPSGNLQDHIDHWESYGVVNW